MNITAWAVCVSTLEEPQYTLGDAFCCRGFGCWQKTPTWLSLTSCGVPSQCCCVIPYGDAHQVWSPGSSRVPSQFPSIILESSFCLSVMLLCTHRLFSGTLQGSLPVLSVLVLSPTATYGNEPSPPVAAWITKNQWLTAETYTPQSRGYLQSLSSAPLNLAFALRISETVTDMWCCSYLEQSMC